MSHVGSWKNNIGKVLPKNHRRFSQGLPLWRSCFRAAKEIIFTRNATEAINLVARTWGAANISLLGGWLFVCIQKRNGEDKKTWKIWDWAKVWWWDSAHGYGQGRHEGPQFGCFNISSFESLSPLITLISFALRAATKRFVHFWLARNIIPIWYHGNS